MRIQTLNEGTRDEQIIVRDDTGLVLAVAHKREEFSLLEVIGLAFVGNVIAVMVYLWWVS